MVKLMKIKAILLLALLIPACSSKERPPAFPDPSVNSDRVVVSVQNDDAVAYNLAIREFVNGTLSSEVRIAWPVAAASPGSPTHAEGSWNFHADSAVYTHSVILYNLSGVTLDERPFVKGPSQLLLVVTISSGTMNVSP